VCPECGLAVRISRRVARLEMSGAQQTVLGMASSLSGICVAGALLVLVFGAPEDEFRAASASAWLPSVLGVLAGCIVSWLLWVTRRGIRELGLERVWVVGYARGVVSIGSGVAYLTALVLGNPTGNARWVAAGYFGVPMLLQLANLSKCWAMSWTALRLGRRGEALRWRRAWQAGLGAWGLGAYSTLLLIGEPGAWIRGTGQWLVPGLFSAVFLIVSIFLDIRSSLMLCLGGAREEGRTESG